MTDPSFSFAVVALALMAGAILGGLAGMWLGRRGGGAPSAAAPSPDRAGGSDASERLRSQALEAVSEPVLVVGTDGRVLECNAAALALLNRHRPAVAGLEALAIRTLVTVSGDEAEWRALADARSPWTGAALVRLPDGSRRAIAVRLVPLFSARGDLAGMVEVYHDVDDEAPPPADRFLRALDALGEPADDEASAEAVERELRLLAMGFADLDRVLRQYQLLLPAMRAEDPITEAVAGLAAETSEVATSADVPRLLREIPRVMTRLRAQLQRLSGRPEAGAGESDGASRPG